MPHMIKISYAIQKLAFQQWRWLWLDPSSVEKLSMLRCDLNLDLELVE